MNAVTTEKRSPLLSGSGASADTGKRHGQGSQTYPDGRKYEGEWENHLERMGTMTLADGTVQKGRFENRKFVGP